MHCFSSLPSVSAKGQVLFPSISLHFLSRNLVPFPQEASQTDHEAVLQSAHSDSDKISMKIQSTKGKNSPGSSQMNLSLIAQFCACQTPAKVSQLVPKIIPGYLASESKPKRYFREPYLGTYLLYHCAYARMRKHLLLQMELIPQPT